ncbi:hypothetical protein TB2_025766 [Malus domestica]
MGGGEGEDNRISRRGSIKVGIALIVIVIDGGRRVVRERSFLECWVCAYEDPTQQLPMIPRICSRRSQSAARDDQPHLVRPHLWRGKAF